MKSKIKEFTKKYLLGFITGLIVCGGASVLAMTYFSSNQTTYDNSNSGLKSTNVQGAIDELYNTCFPPKAGDSILNNVDIVESGDGLYEDEYEDGKYTYKGANPNNYVTFNNEKAGWRIISINSDGTIKIIKNTGIRNMAWDSSGKSDWNRPASLNTYLNSTYYNSLTSTAQSQIVEATYYAGAVTNNNNDMQAQISDEKATASKVKVALPTLSEYIRACSNTSCNTHRAYSNNYYTCRNSDWMYDSSTSWWTLSPNSSSSRFAFIVYEAGNVSGNADGGVADAYSAARPTITLSSSVKITGGNGSKSNPYTLSV